MTNWIESQEGVKLLVGPIENEHYRTTSAIIYRHFELLDNKMNVGTPESDITHPSDDLLMTISVCYLLNGREGVGELNAKDRKVATELGQEESEHVEEIVKKR